MFDLEAIQAAQIARQRREDRKAKLEDRRERSAIYPFSGICVGSFGPHVPVHSIELERYEHSSRCFYRLPCNLCKVQQYWIPGTNPLFHPETGAGAPLIPTHYARLLAPALEAVRKELHLMRPTTADNRTAAALLRAAARRLDP